MPKPTSPWTTSRALESYVYVLPDRYVPQTSGDTSPLFHAKVGDSTHAIRTGDVRNFLEDHRDRTLVAYDALAFHLNCLQAVGDDSSTLWNFSRTHRLWDITLIERRIRYAHVGFAAPIQGREGLENIIRERLESQAIPTDISDMLVALRNILCKQVNWALKNLPLFQTYRADGDIPRPVTIDEYCNRLDAARFVQYRHMSFLPGQDIDRSPAGLYHSSLFRRRDLILTGASGPFGVGIDVQSAIVAHSIDCLSRKDIRPKLTQKSIIYVKTATDRSSQNLNKTSIRNCFHWSDGGDGRNYVTSNNNGNLELFIDRWQRCLHAVWENRPSFITASHTYPKGTDDEISVCPEDWLDYRFLGSPITDWLELEGAASLLHSCTNSTLFSYNAFPVLRSLVPETLSDSDVEGILQAAPNGTFIVIRWVKLLESSLVASVFSAYLLHRRYETQEQYARRFAPIFSPIIPPTFDHDLFLLENDFTDYIRPDYIRPLFSLIYDRNDIESAEIDWLIDPLENLSPELFRRLISETLDSFRLLEHADAYRQRLRRMELSVYDRSADYVYWTILAGAFRFFSTAYPFPFARIPMHVIFQERNMEEEFNEDGDSQIDQVDHTTDPILFRSANINELMLRSAISHFDAKAIGSYDTTDSFFGISPIAEFGWGCINRLHETHYRFFYTQDESYSEIRAAAERLGSTTVANGLPWTNTASSTGRIGPPIRYYEWIDADTRQMMNDIKTSVAFELTAKGFDVVLVAGSQVVVHVPDQPEPDKIQEAKDTVQQAIATTLKSAFPTENSPVDVLDYFVRNKISCTVTPIWPTSEEPNFGNRPDCDDQEDCDENYFWNREQDDE